METKVYTLAHHSADRSETAMRVVGVYTTLEKAQAAMREEYENAKKEYERFFTNNYVEDSISTMSAYVQQIERYNENHDEWLITENVIE